MSDIQPLRASLDALAQFYIGDVPLDVAVLKVCNAAIDALPQAAFAGITLLVEGKPRTGVFTDAESPELDQAQYDSGEGPCLDSFRTGNLNMIDDTRADGPFAVFRAACVARGILSTLSLPLLFDHGPIGALNMYCRQASGFGPDDAETGRLFAAQSAILLANVQVHTDATALGSQLSDALASRAVIEQAKGIIMATTRCTPDLAFEILVRQSQTQNVKLNTIAAEIVQRHSGT